VIGPSVPAFSATLVALQVVIRQLSRKNSTRLVLDMKSAKKSGHSMKLIIRKKSQYRHGPNAMMPNGGHYPNSRSSTPRSVLLRLPPNPKSQEMAHLRRIPRRPSPLSLKSIPLRCNVASPTCQPMGRLLEQLQEHHHLHLLKLIGLSRLSKSLSNYSHILSHCRRILQGPVLHLC
jgi:hypothetical protein